MSCKSQGMYSSIQEPGNCWNHKLKCHLVQTDAYKTQTTSSQPICLLEFLKASLQNIQVISLVA